MQKENIVSLGKFIALRRKHMHLTQEKLAEEMNVSKSAIAKWETDGGIPDRDNMRRISEVLGVSVDDMYRLADERQIRKGNDVNITADVIAALESCGYIVIAPNENVTEDKCNVR